MDIKRIECYDFVALKSYSCPQLTHYISLLICVMRVCLPRQMMKAELSSIRPQLEKLGPMRLESLLPVDDDDDDDDDERGKYAKDDGAVGDSEDGAVVDTADGASRESDNAGNNDEENLGANNNIRQQPTGIPVYHVNTNKFPQVGARNKIGGLPTLVLFLDGEEIWRNEGFMLGKDVLDVLTRLQEDGCWGEKPAATATSNG